MRNGGFQDQSTVNPIGLGLVLAGHAAVLTAIALAPPEAIQRIIFVKTVVKSLPAEKTPPPLPPEALAPTPRSSGMTTTDPIVPPIGLAPFTITPQPLQPEPIQPVRPILADPVFTEAAIDPAAAGRFQPDYPPALVRADIEGSATVRVLIGSDGRVKTIEMVAATDPAFFEATRRQALRFWRFKAATKDGIATESWRTMTVRFQLRT